MRRHKLSAMACGTLAGGLTIALATTSAIAQTTGPSSSQSPYVIPTAPGIGVTSILTVGDSVGGYAMVGIPDGLGAYDNNDGTFTVLMNHELGPAVGAVRAHGATGAFVSEWVVRKSDFGGARQVLVGELGCQPAVG